MKKIIVFLPLFFLAAISDSCIAGCDSISLYYHERIPYVKSTASGVEGLSASPSVEAFQKAGIRFQLVAIPSKRQMKIIEDNRGCDCAIGWFKNSEREKFAKFTAPVYKDNPQIALVRADNPKIKNITTVTSILSNQNLKLEVKDGYSYGVYLDKLIAQYKPTIDKTTVENTNMLKKLHAGRVDYFFITPEEADSLIESSGLPKKDFRYVTFADMPEGEKRYVMCSRNVPDDVIEKINKYLSGSLPARSSKK